MYITFNYYTGKNFKLSHCYNLRTICKDNNFVTQEEDKMRNGDGAEESCKSYSFFF